MSAVLEQVQQPQQELPKQFDVNLPVTDDVRRMVNGGAGALSVAHEFVIDSPEMADAANTELKDVKARLKAAEQVKDDFVKPIKAQIENINKYLMPSILGFQEAEKVLKSKLLTWTQEQQRKAEEERRRQEEIARKARQEAEAKAAAERARAEEQARQKQREAEEAAEKLRKAQEEGDARAAQAAAAAKAKAEEAAQAALVNGEAKANEITLTAAASVPAAPASVPAAPAGFSMRDNWVAVMTAADEEAAKQKLVAGIAAGRTDLLAYIDINTSALNKSAKALKKNFNVPGFEAQNQPVAASRSK